MSAGDAGRAGDTTRRGDAGDARDDLTLWYDRPATDWERESLPIGNGALGAGVFGGVGTERLTLNEKTLWTGGPGSRDGYDHGIGPGDDYPDVLDAVRRRIDDHGPLDPEEVTRLLGRPRRGYGSHQVLGELRLDFPDAPEHPDTYRRDLCLTDATARVTYRHAGVTHHREYLASHPDRVIAARISADTPAAVTFTLRLATPHPELRATADATGRLTLRGALDDNGLTVEAQLHLTAEGGTVTADVDGTSLTVTGADSAVLVLSAGTDYAPTYPRYRGDDPHREVSAAVDRAVARDYPDLRARHVADHAALFDRVTLDLGQRTPDVPTDRLLAGYRGDDTSPDPATDRALEALYFAYGRYLLIASSRAGSLPANLQGVWNDSTAPPWGADYHPNINLQMTYWPARVTNLAETVAPYRAFVEALRAPGRAAAHAMFGAPGWVMHNETNPFGYTGVHDWATAFWFPEAAAWLVQQLHEDYLFDGDLAGLRATGYPAMREAAELWLATLHRDPRDDRLVASPSYSPEHGDFTAGAAMSQQIVWDLFTRTRDAARELDVDADLVTRLEKTLDRLDPGLRIGSWGQLQEWKHDADDPDNRHRHVSHLFALHPGRQLRPGTPEAGAAAVSLDARGDGGTGWSMAWKVNLHARLGHGDRAHRMLRNLLRESTLPNLWDTHPPFQIDGNFGGTAGVAEMLVQSHHGHIHVLPALPVAWPDGAVAGLRARGDVTVGIAWTRGRATRVTLRPGRDGPLRVRWDRGGTTVTATTTAGTRVRVDDDGDVLNLAARRGEVYTITPDRRG